MQISLGVVYFANNAWNTMLSVTSVMVLPAYLGCTLYLWKISRTDEFQEQPGIGRTFAMICGAAGTIYALWMIYAAGLKYLLMAFVFQVIGIPVYIMARRKAVTGKIMSEKEELAAWIMTVVALLGVILLAMGKIKL